jgi:Pectate lyase superfamily protein
VVKRLLTALLFLTLPALAQVQPVGVYPLNGTGPATITPTTIGGDSATSDVVPAARGVSAQSAYPQATTNVTGANLNLAGGLGRRFFTVVSNAALATKTVLITANGTLVTLTASAGAPGANQFGPVGTDDTAPQILVTSTALATAISAHATLGPLMTPSVAAGVVYLQKQPTLNTLVIASGTAGALATATSGVDGLTVVSGFADKGGQVFNVKAYGAVGDGVADDGAAIEVARLAVVAVGGGKLYFPPATYKITGPIVHGSDIPIVFEGAADGASIIIGSGNALLDLSGTSRCVVRNLRFSTSGASVNVGILLSRISGRHSASHSFENVTVNGAFVNAAVYSIGAELVTWSGCRIINTKASATSYAFYTSTENDLSVTSTVGTIQGSADGVTNSASKVISGEIWHNGTGIALGIAGETNQWDFSGYLHSNFRTVVISPSGTNATLSGGISFHDVRFEGTAATAIYMTEIDINKMTIERCSFFSTGAPESGSVIYQAATAHTLLGMTLRGNSIFTNTISVYALAQSWIQGLITVRGICYENVFTGYLSTPTFTGSIANYYRNTVLTGTGLGSYTKTFSGATPQTVGIFTVSPATLVQASGRVMFEIELINATDITVARGEFEYVVCNKAGTLSLTAAPTVALSGVAGSSGVITPTATVTAVGAVATINVVVAWTVMTPTTFNIKWRVDSTDTETIKRL